MREREGLIARIRQVRRVAAAADASANHSADLRADPRDRVGALEGRVAHMERLVEGLQDSVYRESERQSRLIAELQAQIHPGAIRAALEQDARSRGL